MSSERDRNARNVIYVCIVRAYVCRSDTSALMLLIAEVLNQLRRYTKPSVVYRQYCSRWYFIVLAGSNCETILWRMLFQDCIFCHYNSSKYILLLWEVYIIHHICKVLLFQFPQFHGKLHKSVLLYIGIYQIIIIKLAATIVWLNVYPNHELLINHWNVSQF